jgi:hypothetical protein
MVDMAPIQQNVVKFHHSIGVVVSNGCFGPGQRRGVSRLRQNILLKDIEVGLVWLWWILFLWASGFLVDIFSEY